MFNAPTNAPAVYVPIVQTGCLKAEFDSTYPIHLNGIISQHEFQESIQRINRAISSNKILLIIGIVFFLSMIGGIILFVVGGITVSRSYRYGFSVFYGVGMAIAIIGSILFSVACCVIQFRRVDKMRRAIAAESQIYSSRLPTPCSWRLDSSTTYAGYYGNRQRHTITYHLVIDIGRSIPSGSVAYYPNQVAPDSTMVFGGQNNYAPPPYSGQSTAVCPQCNTPQQNSASRFCSSCGQSFNKY